MVSPFQPLPEQEDDQSFQAEGTSPTPGTVDIYGDPAEDDAGAGYDAGGAQNVLLGLTPDDGDGSALLDS